MKPILIILSLLFLKCAAFAQQEFKFDDDDLVYATVKDTDGYVNIRKAPSINAPILGKIYNYTIFSCEPNKTNWWKVLYIQNDSQNKSTWVEGYIYKNRVLILHNWGAANKRGSLHLTIKEELFEPKKHHLSYHKENSNEHIRGELTKIDGNYFWGTDGEIPKKVISNVEVTIKGNNINIPKNAFNDLYEPHLGHISICHGPDNTIYISMSNNSDGAGTYTVIWIVKDNKYYGRYIDDSMV